MARNLGGARDRLRRFGAAALALTAVLAAMAAARESLAQAPGPASREREFEAVKLDDGTEILIEKWGKTYSAYAYRPPVDILDRRVHVVLDAQRDGEPRNVTALAVDSKGGRLYWCEGSSSGRVVRSRLDGGGVHVLATDRVSPRNLVIDPQRGRIYWLEGVGDAPGRLQAATLDGKETTLSKGLNNPGGLALDSARGQLYYWEMYRLIRINVDGSGEEVVTSNRRIAHMGLGSLAFDVARDRLHLAHFGLYGWLDRDGTHLQYVPRMENRGRIFGFALDEDHGMVYFADMGQALRRTNINGTQVETLVMSPAVSPDGISRTIGGAVALDQARKQLYWTGTRAMYPMIYRMDLPPIFKPTERPAPPRIRAIEPANQGPGGEIILAGDGLADIIDVHFIDDSTGTHVKAKFRAEGERGLSVTVPRLGERCRRPVIVVQSPNGVTMTLGTDVIAPKHDHYQYEDVRTVSPDKDPWWLYTNKPYQHERSTAGPGARVWLRPGIMTGNVESAVVYAQRGSDVSFGKKGMVTAFAKDDSHVAGGAAPRDKVVVYHEPFASFLYSTYDNPTIRRIPVPAIRPSFPEQPFRYRAD